MNFDEVSALMTIDFLKFLLVNIVIFFAVKAVDSIKDSHYSPLIIFFSFFISSSVQ